MTQQSLPLPEAAEVAELRARVERLERANSLLRAAAKRTLKRYLELRREVGLGRVGFGGWRDRQARKRDHTEVEGSVVLATKRVE